MITLPTVSSLSLGPFEYRSAKQIADNRREHDILTVAEGRAEHDWRLAFATVYQEFIEKREEKMMARDSNG